MADSVRPRRRQPTRLPRPGDSPGKNTGVGCHFLLQCMKVKSESGVAQSWLILSDLTDCSLPGSSIHGIFQARVLEWGAIAFSESADRFLQSFSWFNFPSLGHIFQKPNLSIKSASDHKCVFRFLRDFINSPDNCVMKGHLLCQKQILLTQAEMSLVCILYI